MFLSEQAILIFAAAAFGLIIGSFLNALSFRFNTGRNILKAMGGRSRCMHCSHELGALDLVPVFSFLFLGAKCRYCHSKISWQYPTVEVVAGALSVLVFLAHPEPLAYAFWFIVWMALLFVVVYDIKHTIIPWSCSGFLALLALIALFVSFDGGIHIVIPSFWALAAGPLLALPLFLLSLVSAGTWMGWGDSALELSLGWFLGITAGLSGLMLAFWSGAIIGIILLALSGLKFFGYTIRSEIPFAPFLVLGAALSYFFHVNFFPTILPF